MKKFVGLLILFLFAGTVGCKTIHYLIVNIRIEPLEKYTNPNTGNESYRYPFNGFKNEIIFGIRGYITEQIAGTIKLSTGSQCYATKQGCVIDNSLLEDTFSMTFDKSFTYTGKTIEAGVNIMKDPTIIQEITIIATKNPCYGDFLYLIQFNDAFVQNAIFDNNGYIVTFSCMTSDDIYLKKSLDVMMPQ